MNTNKKVLLLTVGGSSAPLIGSIDSFEPDEIVFICTGQSKKEIKGILNSVSVSCENYFTEDVPPDNADKIFAKCRDVIASYQKVGSNVLADFTGGTKPMSFALAAAATVSNIPLRFMTGDRSDLVKVVDGTQQPMQFNFLWVEFELAKRLFNKYDFAAAELLFIGVRDSATQEELRKKADWYGKLAKGFDLWDKFEHNTAFTILRPFIVEYPNLANFLNRVVEPQKRRDANQFELIIDLLANAQRCAFRKRYDDACARLYRVVELLAQKRLLLEYEIDTSNADPAKFPQDFKPPEPNRNGIYQLSRYKAYGLLEKKSDRVFEIYAKYRSFIDNNMNIRNNSIMAHGERPVSGKDYRCFSEVVTLFLKEAFGVLGVKWEEIEFPRID